MWWLVWGSRFGVVGQPQAVLSFGPSAPLHPPAALRLRVPAYGRGWPGSSEQHRLRPCISTPSHFLLYLPPALYVRRVGSQAVLSFGPSAPLHPPRCASLAGTRLRPRVARVLRTTPLTALHIHSFPLLAAPPPLRCMFDGWDRKQYCPSDLPLRSIPPAALRLRVPAYGRGCTVRDHRLAYGWPFSNS